MKGKIGITVLVFFVCLLIGRGAAAATGTVVMYLFAHQDDEALIAAKIATDLRLGRDVHAVWITDGSGTAPADVREAESRAVMRRLGVPPENLVFLGYRDRDSWKHLDAVLDDVLRIVNTLKPAEITANAYEGGNIDHDVASLMAWLASRRALASVTVYEFPLYNTYKSKYQVNVFLPRAGVETLYMPLDDTLLRLKDEVLSNYASQKAIVDALKMIIDKKSLKKHGEPYRLAPAYDYTKRSVDGPLGYELNKRNPVSFDDWSGAVVPFLKKLGIP
jgi:LmbE family N-acetylglucosaminyl deacetylase